jgi:branched-subunit amino acid ABC-type transport system permease component
VKRAKSSLLASSILIAALGVNSAQAAIATTMLTEKNAAKIVVVKLGGHVDLTWHSMYWQLKVPPKSASLTSNGAPILKPIFPGPKAPAGCKIAGSGCGTQTWAFTATKVGLTHLVANRTTCGEAMRCTAANGRFAMTVKVSR